MQFAKHLRERVVQGEITSTVRIWLRPRVRVDGCYGMGDGEVHVDSIEQISLDEITDEMAHQSGFADVEALLKTAKHGKGENVYFITFHYRDYLGELDQC